jgi:hypothetical protein
MSRGLFRLVVVRSGWWVVRYCVTAPPEDDPRGLKHVGAKNTKTKKVQIVISCAFNNKKLVHFVGIIIV